MQILHYLGLEDRDPYQGWLEGLRDMRAKVAILRRVERLKSGSFGDHSFCRDGVWELRVDIGAGYRVYYSRAGKEVILLLWAGSKRTQDADIDRAVRHWQDYLRRSR